MPAILPDLEPLRASREFRLLWVGQFVSRAGNGIRLVAVPYQVYLLTGSSLAVGLLGLFAAVPIIVLSLWGGVIADRVDRRRMLIITNVCLALTSVALALSTQLGMATIPVLYVLTAVGSGFSALDQPARSALAPSLVERRLIPATIALNQTSGQVMSVIGPAVAGLVIARFGLALAYWIDVATYLAAFVALLVMRVPDRDLDVVHAAPLRALAEGMAFLLSRRLLLATMLVDFFATFFAVSRAVMPYFADRVFGVGPEGLGLLYAAPAIGATVVVLTSGWITQVQRRGLGILVAVAVFGLTTALFGFLPGTGFLAGLALLAIADGADAVSAMLRHTILQLEAPDALRGRLSAINLVFVAGGPQLGQIESGVVADLWSPEASIVTGGLACVAAVFIAHALAPEVARYRADLQHGPATG